MEAIDLFEILVRENAKMLRSFISSAIKDGSAVDDIWQETMWVAWRRIDDFDRGRPFGPWLRGIASKVILSYAQKLTKREASVSSGDLEYLSDRISGIEKLAGDTFQEKLAALKECTEALASDYQKVVKLRFLDGIKPAEISATIGQGIETVKKRLFRAKGQLLQCIERKIEATES